MRWTQGANQGTILEGGTDQGAGARLVRPMGLSFDRHDARKEQIFDDFNDTSKTSTRSISSISSTTSN
ncbi:unnamed protein product, partial [Rotaria magnacalcarata]